MWLRIGFCPLKYLFSIIQQDALNNTEQIEKMLIQIFEKWQINNLIPKQNSNILKDAFT